MFNSENNPFIDANFLRESLLKPNFHSYNENAGTCAGISVHLGSVKLWRFVEILFICELRIIMKSFFSSSIS